MRLELYLEENALNALTKTLNAYVRKGKSLKVQELITIYLKKSGKNSKTNLSSQKKGTNKEQNFMK